MKRIFAILLTLCLALSLCACAKRETPPAAPEPDGAPSVEPTKPEEIPQEWDYDLTTETASEEYKNDDGVLLATWSYEQPILQLKNAAGETFLGELPIHGVTEEQLAVCRAFNDATSESVRDALAGFEDLKAGALEQWNEMGEAYRESFAVHEEETSVAGVFRRGDLLEVATMMYGYWGGVHGGTAVRHLHFDLDAGEFFALGDLTDRATELYGALADEILTQIYASGESEWYFDDFYETIRNKDDYNVSFGENALTAYFDQYEIAPYVMGILEFEIPYANIAQYLNERGERLLPLSDEDHALGDFYEAQAMWSWFDGNMPFDDADRREAPAPDGDYVMEYYRVELPGVTTLDELRGRLLTRFAENVADERLAEVTGAKIPLLREFDGVLCVLPAGRGDNMMIDSVDYRAELDKDGSGGTVYATIQWRDFDDATEDWVLTGQSELAFPFVQTETGARFTEFHSIF